MCEFISTESLGILRILILNGLLSSGDKLQFIFTGIDPKKPERPYMFSLCLNEARDYEGMYSHLLLLFQITALNCFLIHNIRKLLFAQAVSFSVFLLEVQSSKGC